MSKILPDELCPCGSGYIFKECHGPRVQKKTNPEIKDYISLKVIPEPDPNTRSVFIKSPPDSIIFQGYETNLALVCGKCNAILVAGLKMEQIKNSVIKCNKCQSYNEVN